MFRALRIPSSGNPKMSHPSQPPLSARQIFRALRHHPWLGVCVFGTTFGLVILLWLALPRKYGSEGKLFVQAGRANVAVTGGGDAGSGISIQDTRETEIRSVAELITSYDLLGAIVDELGPGQFLDKRFPFSIDADLSRWFPASRDSGDPGIGQLSEDEYRRIRLREDAINELERNLKVSSEKKTSVISVYCLAFSPRMAQTIVERVMQKVQEKHLAIHSASRSRDFFDREYELQRRELVDAEKRLADFRNEFGILSIEQTRNTLGGVIEKLENERVDTQIELNQSQARIAELVSQAVAVKQELTMPTTGMELLSTEEAQSRLYARIAEKSRLMAKYKAGHPKLLEIDAEIESLQAEVAALPQDRQQTIKEQNPVYEQLKVALVLEESNARSLASRLEQVEKSYSGSKARLVELNRLELVSAERQRDVDVAARYFEIYARRRGDVKVGDQLDKQAISDVVIAQPASLVLKKQSPRGSIMLPLGLLLATFSTLLVTLLADRKNLSGSCSTDEMEEVLHLPVLATIPRVHPARVLSN
jgi:uncharacterized protein involved in exopolysaccharide biosynthesis